MFVDEPTTNPLLDIIAVNSASEVPLKPSHHALTPADLTDASVVS